MYLFVVELFRPKYLLQIAKLSAHNVFCLVLKCGLAFMEKRTLLFLNDAKSLVFKMNLTVDT